MPEAQGIFVGTSATAGYLWLWRGGLCFFCGRCGGTVRALIAGAGLIAGMALVDIGATDLCQLLDALRYSKLPRFVRNACYRAAQFP